MKFIFYTLVSFISTITYSQQTGPVKFYFEKFGDNPVQKVEIEDCYYISFISGTDTIIPFKRGNEIIIPASLKDNVTIFLRYNEFVACFYDVPTNLINNSKNNKWIFQVFDKPFINSNSEAKRTYNLSFFNLGIAVESEDD